MLESERERETGTQKGDVISVHHELLPASFPQHPSLETSSTNNTPQPSGKCTKHFQDKIAISGEKTRNIQQGRK